MPEPRPTRQMSGLPEMVEMLLEKGVVVNADVVVSVGDTELIGIKLRAAIASFDTAAKYGLEFPEGTNMERVERQADVSPIKRPGEAPPEGARRAIQEGQRTLAEELDLSMEENEDAAESGDGGGSEDAADSEDEGGSEDAAESGDGGGSEDATENEDAAEGEDGIATDEGADSEDGEE